MLSLLSVFAQTMSDYSTELDTTYTTTLDPTTTGADAAVGAASLGILMVIYLIIFVVAVIPAIVVSWKLFKKAGRPGWAALVPIYNTWVMNDIAGTPTWYFILSLMPSIGFIGYILIYIELAKKYSKPATVWFGMFLPIVALFMVGKTEYIGGGDAPQAPQGFSVPPQPQQPAPQVQPVADVTAPQPVPVQSDVQPQSVVTDQTQPPTTPQPPTQPTV